MKYLLINVSEMEEGEWVKSKKGGGGLYVEVLFLVPQMINPKST